LLEGQEQAQLLIQSDFLVGVWYGSIMLVNGVGNQSRWKDGAPLELELLHITALFERENGPGWSVTV
jgi:hypothetical protein